MQDSSYYLILDRTDPRSARWVIAETRYVLPVQLADTGLPVGGAAPAFAWMHRVFGRFMRVRDVKKDTNYAARIVDYGVWTLRSYPPYHPHPYPPSGSDARYELPN